MEEKLLEKPKQSSTKPSVKPSALASLRPQPDRSKAMKIVEALDTSGDGFLSVSEVKVLFSKLLKIPIENIPDDHPEVKAFAGMKTDEMVTKLCKVMTKAQVEDYYAALFPKRG